jgi:hypothetical protein
MADPAFEAEVNDIEVRHPTVIPEAGVPPPSPSCAHARRPFDASCSQANLKQSLISKAKPCVGIFLRAPDAALHTLTPSHHNMRRVLLLLPQTRHKRSSSRSRSLTRIMMGT